MKYDYTAFDFTNHRRIVPFVPQSEASECGLACIAMIAGYHGKHIDLSSLRKLFNPSMKGMTLRDISDVLISLDLSNRALKMDIADLKLIDLPAIIHWDMSHFVVLTKVSRSGNLFTVFDPGYGPREIHIRAISDHFTGIALEIAPSVNFRPQDQRQRLKLGQLWSKAIGLKRSLFTVFIMSIVMQAITLAMPFYMQLSVDTAIPSFDVSFLTMLAAGFIALAIIHSITGWLRTVFLMVLSSSLSFQLVSNLKSHLIKLPFSWYEKRHIGDVLSRFNSVRPISDLLSQGFVASILDGIMALFTIALLIVFSFKLALLAIATLLIIAIVKLISFKLTKLANVNAIAAAAKENSIFIETIRGISSIKAFGQGSNRHRIWQASKAKSTNADIKLSRISSFTDALVQGTSSIERIIFLYVAFRLVMANEITTGMAFAFQSYKQQFMDASIRLIDQCVRYKLLDVHLARLADIALEQPEAGGDPQGGTVRRVSPSIEFRNVSFRYGSGDEDVIKDVTFKVKPGEIIALTGPSGGGKTTVLKLCAGLIEPTAGDILINGEKLSRIGVNNWRNNIGIVLQDDTLFAGTISENISFFSEVIDHARVQEVSKLVNIDKDIRTFPLGYETLVGDMGSVLSGGQKQRVLLARALYARPSTLIMDEGTANLDLASEMSVMKAVGELNITRIISAHRPAPIRQADRVLIVANGCIKEEPPTSQITSAAS